MPEDTAKKAPRKRRTTRTRRTRRPRVPRGTTITRFTLPGGISIESTTNTK